MFGFSSTLLCTWEVIALYVIRYSFSNNETLSNFFSRTLGNSLPNGGTAGLFWNYIIASIGLGFVYASIAELGSMYGYNYALLLLLRLTLSRIPTSGGQYYWVAVLAPRSARRYLSFITGGSFHILSLYLLSNHS